FPSVKSYTNFGTGSSFSLRFHPAAVPARRGGPRRRVPAGCGGSAALFAGTVPATSVLPRRPVRGVAFSQVRSVILVYSTGVAGRRRPARHARPERPGKPRKQGRTHPGGEA